jgi:hypothetical protein
MVDLISDIRWATTEAVLDTGSGYGAFGKAVKARCPEVQVIGVDKFYRVGNTDNAEFYDRFFYDDYLRLSTFGDKTGIILGCPPAGLAQAFVEHSLSLLPYGGALVYLLPLSFLGSVGRKKLFQEAPPFWIHVIVPRPSFKPLGRTDRQEYAVFQWVKGASGAPRLGWL